MNNYHYSVVNHNDIDWLRIQTNDEDEGIHLPVAGILETIQQSFKPDTPTRPTTEHCGIIRISDELLHEIAPEIQIDECNTQRQLRARGVFALIKERLLLPESYTVHFIWAQYIGIEWAILVESPELPCMSVGMNGLDYPELECLYCRDENGPHLVEIKARIQQTVHVKGGYDYLIKSVMGDL